MFKSPVGSEHRDGVVRVVPESDGIVAVCLEQEFDLSNAPALGDQLERVLEGSDLILDMSEATFIDSSVLNVLAQASKIAREEERTMVLQVGTAAIVERVLDIARVDRLLPRVETRQAAVDLIRQKRDVV